MNLTKFRKLEGGNAVVFLKCSQISKSFGLTQALAKVDLEVKRGEIHGLIGENGSG